MNNKVEWGVFGVSDLAVKKVIPAMQRGEWSQVAAIASRDLKRAQQAAERLGIPKNLSENAQASRRTIRWIMAILIQASLVRGLIS